MSSRESLVTRIPLDAQIGNHHPRLPDLPLLPAARAIPMHLEEADSFLLVNALNHTTPASSRRAPIEGREGSHAEAG